VASNNQARSLYGVNKRMEDMSSLFEFTNMLAEMKKSSVERAYQLYVIDYHLNQHVDPET